MVADTGVALHRIHSKIDGLKRINEAKLFLSNALVVLRVVGVASHI